MEIVKVNRRDFVKITSVASAGLVIGLRAPRAEAQESAHPLGAFVHVGTDGSVTVYVSKSDMGQGVRTALPMIVAEELGADWKKIKIVQADLDKKYGRQGTGGSSSIRTMYKPLRQAGATARAMLLTAAAAKWGVNPGDCNVEDCMISHGPQRAHFGEVAEAAAQLDVPKDVKLKDDGAFK
ncbi:MAG: molybdopterin-dependent oxidoreductase, partial [Alphaproteobacteria bacterium]|nr:molybdopterin-dependent oxidoreductase [Alphaproteobacteria bacterium]